MQTIKDKLIKAYKEKGKFTYDEHLLFRNPTQEILDMVIESDDFNFRKTCVFAIMDYQTNEKLFTDYKDFIKNPKVINVLKAHIR
jgi:hypothetical protein